MGFSNAIYKYPKYKDITLSQIRAIEDYYSYDTNDWAQKNFENAHMYMMYNRSNEHFQKPTQEEVDYYKQFLHKDEYGYLTISDDLYYSCSAGIPFHEDIENVLGLDVNKSSVELTQKDLIKLLSHEIKKLSKYELLPTTISNSFIYLDEDNGEDEKSILLKRCDGVELEYEDGTSKRLETNSKYEEYGTLLMTCKEYVDEYEYNFQFGLVQELARILEEVDFEKECLCYSGGW